MPSTILLVIMCAFERYVECLVPYCCIFCALLNDMLNVATGTFSFKKLNAPKSRACKNLHAQIGNSHNPAMHDQRNIRFGDVFPKPTAMICVN